MTMKSTFFCGVTPCSLVFANSFPRYLLHISSVHSENLVLLFIAKFEDVTAVNMEVTFFWDVTPCSLVDIYQLVKEPFAFIMNATREHRHTLHWEIRGSHSCEWRLLSSGMWRRVVFIDRYYRFKCTCFLHFQDIVVGDSRLFWKDGNCPSSRRHILLRWNETV
jgi:hypothetical protein